MNDLDRFTYAELEWQADHFYRWGIRLWDIADYRLRVVTELRPGGGPAYSSALRDYRITVEAAMEQRDLHSLVLNEMTRRRREAGINA